MQYEDIGIVKITQGEHNIWQDGNFCFVVRHYMDGPIKQKHFGVLLLHVCACCSAIVCVTMPKSKRDKKGMK